MLVIVGYLVILGAVFGGFAIGGGHLGSLLQPVELLMIGGAALGAFLVANPIKVIKATLKALPSLMRGSRYSKALYVETLSLLYDILAKIRKEGLMSVESDVDVPDQSPLFAKYPKVICQEFKHMAIVGHEHKAPGIAGKPFFEPANGIEVEVVGRLIENQ